MSDPLKKLRDFTNARVALGRTGHSIPTQAHLKFRLDHAEARDAVYLPVNFEEIEAYLNKKNQRYIQLTSKAETREIYLQRPDLGRKLNKDSVKKLSKIVETQVPADVALVIEDGLSARAIHEQVIPFLDAFLPLFEKNGLSVAPITLVHQGRVAIGDEIGALLQSKIVVVLVGERPGLTVPDSLGLYFTYLPKKGLTDDRRNCISNIHGGGLSHQLAAAKGMYMIQECLRHQLSGVALKEGFTEKNSIS